MAASRAANADTADLPEYDWDEISVGVWDEIGGEGNCSQRFFGEWNVFYRIMNCIRNLALMWSVSKHILSRM